MCRGGLGWLVFCVGLVAGCCRALTRSVVHHEGDPGLAPDLADAHGEDALGIELDVALEGEPEVLAVHRLHGAVLAERDAVASPDLAGRRAVGSGQLLVDGALEPAERALVFVLAGEPDQVGCDVVRGIVPHRTTPRAARTSTP